VRRPVRFAGRRIDATAATAVAVGGAALLLRLPRLGDAFWQDEVASARVLREPTPARMLAHVIRTESTPPLWYALAWLVHRVGVPLQDERLLSAAAIALLAGLVVVAARFFVPPLQAAAAGVLVAVGGEFAAAGSELRAYALLALLAALFAFALDATARRPRRRTLVALGLVTAAGSLTHYFFLFTVAAGLLWLWVEPQRPAGRVRATAAIAAGLALAAPWLPFALRQYHADRYSWIGPFAGRVVANTLFRLFTPLVHVEWVPLALLALTAVGAARLARHSPRGRLCAALAFGPVAAAALAWRLGVRIYAVRNLIEAGAFAAVCAVAGVSPLAPRLRAVAAATLAAAALAGFAWEQQVPAAPYAGIARTLVAEGWRPTTPVLVFGSPYAFRSPLEWYLPHDPRLDVLRAARAACRVVYVVAGRRATRVVADDVVAARRVGRFLVGRLRLDDRLDGRHASLLAAPQAVLRCGSRSVAA
jgi:MFS family permease